MEERTERQDSTERDDSEDKLRSELSGDGEETDKEGSEDKKD